MNGSETEVKENNELFRGNIKFGNYGSSALCFRKCSIPFFRWFSLRIVCFMGGRYAESVFFIIKMNISFPKPTYAVELSTSMTNKMGLKQYQENYHFVC